MISNPRDKRFFCKFFFLKNSQSTWYANSLVGVMIRAPTPSSRLQRSVYNFSKQRHVGRVSGSRSHKFVIFEQILTNINVKMLIFF